jgi:hypothetical protein
MLEFHVDRWYNSRPYVAGGFNYLMNLQSNSTSADDNQQGFSELLLIILVGLQKWEFSFISLDLN